MAHPAPFQAFQAPLNGKESHWNVNQARDSQQITATAGSISNQYTAMAPTSGLLSQSEQQQLNGWFDAQLGSPAIPLRPSQTGSYISHASTSLQSSMAPSAFAAPYPPTLLAGHPSANTLYTRSEAGRPTSPSSSSMRSEGRIGHAYSVAGDVAHEHRMRNQAQELASWLEMRGFLANKHSSAEIQPAPMHSFERRLSHGTSTMIGRDFYPATQQPPQQSATGPHERAQANSNYPSMRQHDVHMLGASSASTSSTSTSEPSLPTPTLLPANIAYRSPDLVHASPTLQWQQSLHTLHSSDSGATGKASASYYLDGHDDQLEASHGRTTKRPRVQQKDVTSQEASQELPTLQAKRTSSASKSSTTRRKSSSASTAKRKSSMSASLAQVAAPRADCSASAAHLGVKTDGVDEMPESTTLDDTTSPPSQIVPSIARAVPLTEEQKRANHIMSEQRRRTAIKAAYDELCVAVPALRAAIREYDERLSKVAGSQRTVSTASGNNNAAGIAGVLTGGIEVGGEKIDGRAGPKSEAVVLAKTVDYLRTLLDDREALLDRLSSLQRSRSTEHHAIPIWNQKWKA
ncbi:hypothetical protein EMMF5_005007 [Cystobasidiomycetes sp. EMM_F5]